MIKRYKGDKAKADKLFSRIIRDTGYCEAYTKNNLECSAILQCAHIVSRRFNVTRTDTRNAFCLCFAHHRFYTDHPREFSHFITDTWAAKYYDTVYANARALGKVDWLERIKFLKQIELYTLPELREMEP